MTSSVLVLAVWCYLDLSLDSQLKIFHNMSQLYKYWGAGQDVTQEIAKFAESAALASAAHSAHFSVSCATSCLVTQ